MTCRCSAVADDEDGTRDTTGATLSGVLAVAVALVLTAGWTTPFAGAAGPGRVQVAEGDGPQSASLLVVNKSGHSLSILGPESGEERARVPTGRAPHGIDVAPDGTLSEISVSRGEVTRTLEVGRFPIRVAALPGGGELLVSDARANEVVRVGVDAWEVTGRIPVDSAPVGIQLTSDGRRAFVANTRDDRIAVLDVERGEVTGPLTAGEEPDGMAWISGRDG